jgi:hypothetical protein
MSTLAQFSAWLASILDYPLGWLLALPRDVAIMLVALGTSLLLTLVRKWTTNQDQLGRSRSDVRRLKQLIREAKRAKDEADRRPVGPSLPPPGKLERLVPSRPAVKPMRTTLAMVNGIRLKAEGLPLLVSIVPIALLAVWAVERLDYFPPRVGQELTVRAYCPLSSVGKLTHLVPPPALEMKSDAIRLVEIDPDGEQNGLATWALQPCAASDSAELLIRHEGETASHTVSIGRRSYAAPLAAHDGGKILVTEVVLRRAKFLGIVPGIPAIAFPPWLVAYLIIVIPLVPLLRRGLRVY